MMRETLVLQEGDGIEISRRVASLYHKCCNCGQIHHVSVKWEKNSIILKWFAMPPAKAEGEDKPGHTQGTRRKGRR